MAEVFYPTPEEWAQLMAMLGGGGCIVIVSPKARQQLEADLRNSGGELPSCPDDYDWSDPDLFIDWVYDSGSWGYEQLLEADNDEEDDEEEEEDEEE